MENAMRTLNSRQTQDLITQLRHRAARVMAGWTNRKGLAVLAKFDDRALADIGLTRSDLYDALAHRVWDDPTTMLERRRIARRDCGRSPAQMLGLAGLAPPKVDRPARHLV